MFVEVANAEVPLPVRPRNCLSTAQAQAMWLLGWSELRFPATCAGSRDRIAGCAAHVPHRTELEFVEKEMSHGFNSDKDCENQC